MERRIDCTVAVPGNSPLHPRRQNSRRWGWEGKKNLLSKNNIKITFDVCYVTFYFRHRVVCARFFPAASP